MHVLLDRGACESRESGRETDGDHMIHIPSNVLRIRCRILGILEISRRLCEGVWFIGTLLFHFCFPVILSGGGK